LFGPSNNPIFKLNHDCWDQHERVSDEENNHLIRPFSEEEVKSGDEYEEKYSSRT
jgi:hypothetical protein